MSSFRGPRRTVDLQRIVNLPRRSWEQGLGGRHGTTEEVATLLEDLVRQEGSHGKLRRSQVRSLDDLFNCRGLVSSARVGAGKTLVTLLAPVVLRSKRPILIVLGGLREKTINEARDEYSVNWRVPEIVALRNKDLTRAWPDGQLLVLSYAQLSIDHIACNKIAETLLQALLVASDIRLCVALLFALWRERVGVLTFLEPDLLMFDEVHKLANPKSGRSKKVERFVSRVRLRERFHGQRLIVAGLTGSLGQTSIMEYAHIMRWSLGEGAPVPTAWREVRSWSEVLDQKSQLRPSVGGLACLCSEDEQESLQKSPHNAVANAFGRRLVETPGVVAVDHGDVVGVKLTVDREDLSPPAVVLQGLERVRTRWETPGGNPFADAFRLAQVLRQVAMGFWYEFAPPGPPAEWLKARRAWCDVCRKVLRVNRRGWDTELQVRRAVLQGEIDRSSYDILNTWLKVKDKFDPIKSSVVRWLDGFVIDFVKRWLSNRIGIVWTSHRALGRRIGSDLGIPYFAAKGRSGSLRIETWHQSCVAAIGACSTGRNLQHFHENLILGPDKIGEQLFGRTHRDGQPKNVQVDVLLTIPEHSADVQKAHSQALWVKSNQQTRQKILTCDGTLFQGSFLN